MASKVPGKTATRRIAKPALLAGGNPKIAKSGGDAPVQAYIAAMPGWKRVVGRRGEAPLVPPYGAGVSLLASHSGPQQL